MHSRRLHSSLHEYAEQAALALSAQVDAGSEVGFEVIQEGGRGSSPALYCYQPLTADFLAEHVPELRALPAHGAAVHALGALDNLAAYARSPAKGQRELAEAALERFLCRVFEEGAFTITPERFEPAYREVEDVLVEGRTETILLCLLRGITAESPEIQLGRGAALAPLECLEQLPPDPLWLVGEHPSLVIAIATEAGGPAGAIDRACELQGAIRLFAPGIACEPIAWLRGESGTWRAVALGAGRCAGARRERALAIAPEQEDELRAFCNLIAHRLPAERELGWALERFEFGLDRDDALAGLTDHLLALRALLEPEGPRSGRLAGRLAVLCAVQDQQAALAERVARAISLEAAVVSGAEGLGSADGVDLALELEGHLRALLRDLLCGHLPRDLVSLADELLLDSRARGPEHEDAPADANPPAGDDAPTGAYDFFDDEEPAHGHGEVPALPHSQRL
ncbi:MAG: hypothetical protein ACR2ND_07475 [Solirubrobacteraceae bacterium]